METDALDGSRTVVVSGVPDLLPAYRMEEKLTVHFQSRRKSHGGDVEVVTYPTSVKGLAFVTFDRAADAQTAVQKEQQVLQDKTFPEEYVLTVFPFTPDVFFYVSSANVDLSLFQGDQASLIQSLRSAHRSLRFQAWPRQRKATVEGPFAAVRALREDLERRADQFKAGVKPKEFPANPRVISHHGSASPVSRSDSKAKREAAAGSDGLSSPLHSTGEGSEVQSQLSNAKTPNSARQKARSVYDTGTEEEQIAASRSKLTRPPSAERPQARPTQSHTEDVNAGARSKLPRGSTKQPVLNHVMQKHGSTDTISAAQTSWTPLDSYSSTSDFVKDSHQTRLKAAPVPSSSGPVKSQGLDPDDASVWVDVYVFKYIEKLDKEYERCLRGLSASVEEVEDSDLVRICLSEKPPSEGGSRVQRALKNLQALVERWQSTLRVHEASCNQKTHSKQRLMELCRDVQARHGFHDVLYMVEDARIQFVGPSVTSYLFYIIVEQRLQWDVSLPI